MVGARRTRLEKVVPAVEEAVVAAAALVGPDQDQVRRRNRSWLGGRGREKEEGAGAGRTLNLCDTEDRG